MHASQFYEDLRNKKNKRAHEEAMLVLVCITQILHTKNMDHMLDQAALHWVRGFVAWRYGKDVKAPKGLNDFLESAKQSIKKVSAWACMYHAHALHLGAGSECMCRMHGMVA